jgi:putative DNA primase/helicase
MSAVLTAHDWATLDKDRAKMLAANLKEEVRAPEPLPSDLLPVESFPLDALPESFRPWVEDVSDRMQCPPDYVAIPMLVGAASLVARRVSIRPKRKDEWTVRGNLWAMCVGGPGRMKSPAQSEALACMDRLEARAATEFNDELTDHKAASMAQRLKAEANVKQAKQLLAKDAAADVRSLLVEDQDEASPTRRRYVVNDLTYEKLGEVLSVNPDGILLVRDEMRGLLSMLAREENAPARSFYLMSWSGGRYTFDRIGRGTLTIEDAKLSIMGSIQPGPLSEIVQQARRGAADDGMLDRFLVAWPDAVGEWRDVDRPANADAKAAAWSTFDRLDRLTAERLGAEVALDPNGQPKGLPFLRLAEDGYEAFAEWRRDLERTIREADGEGLEGALSKYRHHVPALALSMHVIDGGTGPVSDVAMLKALRLAEYFESHTRRMYGSGRRLMVEAARKILSKAKSGALAPTFTVREVYRHQWSGLTEKQLVSEALDLLAAHGWMTELSPEADAAGRPTARYCLSKGALHE